MRRLIEYILINKQWLFSGLGVFTLSGAFALIRRFFRRRVAQTDGEQLGVHLGEVRHGHQALRSSGGKGEDGAEGVVPREWQGIRPHPSKYKFVSKTTTEIPLGLQSFSFEYGPQGHAEALILRGGAVRAEIEFTCRIDNPYKALFSANEYALNVLPPRFLLQARNTLEAYSLRKLRESRLEASRAIVATMAPQFQELGVRLESVTIGALERVR
jgi:hypothetical protein